MISKKGNNSIRVKDIVNLRRQAALINKVGKIETR